MKPVELKEAAEQIHFQPPISGCILNHPRQSPEPLRDVRESHLLLLTERPNREEKTLIGLFFVLCFGGAEGLVLGQLADPRSASPDMWTPRSRRMSRAEQRQEAETGGQAAGCWPYITPCTCLNSSPASVRRHANLQSSARSCRRFTC